MLNNVQNVAGLCTNKYAGMENMYQYHRIEKLFPPSLRCFILAVTQFMLRKLLMVHVFILFLSNRNTFSISDDVLLLRDTV
jgi:hypothetical protein